MNLVHSEPHNFYENFSRAFLTWPLKGQALVSINKMIPSKGILVIEISIFLCQEEYSSYSCSKIDWFEFQVPESFPVEHGRIHRYFKKDVGPG